MNLDADVELVARATDSQRASTEAVEPPTAEWRPRRQETLIMVTLSLISLMVALDASILVPALPAIAKALNGTANEAFWAGTSYLLTSSIFQPFLASLSDIFGRQYILCLAISFFLLGTICCAVANNFPLMLAGRSIQGIGGGGVMSLVLIIFSDIVPLRQRPVYISYVQVAWAIGTISGPVIGGAIVQKTTWRWIFYINFPFCAFGLLVVPFVVRLKSAQTSLGQKLLEVDWIGALLFIASTTALLIGITWGGVQYAWGSYQTLLPICLGVGGVGVTLLWERLGVSKPFIRLQIFQSRSAAAVYVCAIVQGLILYGDLYYIPFYLETVKALSPVMTGVGLMPITVGIIPTTMIVGKLVAKIGRFRWAVWSGWAVTILGTGLLITLDVQIETWQWILCLLVLGLGHGMILSTLTYTIQVVTSDEDGPHALAMYTAIRTFGMCVGVAVGGTAFQNLLSKYLGESGLDSGIARESEGYVAVLTGFPIGSSYRKEVVGLYARAFRGVFEVFTGISVLGGLAGLLLRSHSMNRDLRTAHGLKRES